MKGPQVLCVPRILCILLVAICKWAFSQSHETERISYGKPYDHDMYPYVVALIIQEEGNSLTKQVCTGTMISPLFALTAAHCTRGTVVTDITVFLGVSGQDQYNIPTDRQQSVAEVYQYTTYNNHTDISLVKLNAPFPGLDRFAVISGHPDDFADDKELNCTNIGFGRTEKGDNAVDDGFHNTLPDHGLAINVIIMYGKCLLTVNDFERKEYLCAKANQHVRMCAGDSGGPLICGEGLQYGVTSHSSYTHSETDEPTCGSSDSEDHYVFVYNYKDWIYAKMANNDCTTVRSGGCAFIIYYILVISITLMMRARI